MSQGKPSIRCSKAMAYAMDALSKSALIDIVLDRAIAEAGGDAPEQHVLAIVMRWLNPVAALRGDRPAPLSARYESWNRQARAYREKHGITE